MARDGPLNTNSGDLQFASRRRPFNPFLFAFRFLWDLTIGVLQPGLSAFELENDYLQAQLESQNGAMADEIRRYEELEERNSTLDAAAIKSLLEGEKMLDVMLLREQEMNRIQEQLADEIKRNGRLEQQLQVTEKTNCELEEQMKNQESLMKSLTTERTQKLDKERQTNRSLKKQLKK